jgi:hypothetical protein
MSQYEIYKGIQIFCDGAGRLYRIDSRGEKEFGTRPYLWCAIDAVHAGLNAKCGDAPGKTVTAFTFTANPSPGSRWTIRTPQAHKAGNGRVRLGRSAKERP